MPKMITVSNLPVTTLVVATVRVDDGPESTLDARIAAAVRAGRWERAHGSLAKDYEDLDLLPDEEALSRPLWSFDVLSGATTTAWPRSVPRGTMPSREHFDAAWAWSGSSGGAGLFSFDGDERAGTDDLTRDQLWAVLKTVHTDHVADGTSPGFRAKAGEWCEKVLVALDIGWE